MVVTIPPQFFCSLSNCDAQAIQNCIHLVEVTVEAGWSHSAFLRLNYLENCKFSQKRVNIPVQLPPQQNLTAPFQYHVYHCISCIRNISKKYAIVAVHPPVLKGVKIAHLGLNCREESQDCKFASKLRSKQNKLLSSQYDVKAFQPLHSFWCLCDCWPGHGGPDSKVCHCLLSPVCWVTSRIKETDRWIG